MEDYSIDKKAFLKCFLRDFYTEKINKQIYEKVKNFTIHDNLIFKVNYNFETIKNIISILLIKEFKNNINYNYHAIGLYKMIELSFNNHSEESQAELEKIKKCSTLIIYEFNDMDHSLYKSLYDPLISERVMKGKSNILLLCNKSPSDLMNINIINGYFTEIPIKNVSFKSKIKDDSIF